MQGVVLNADDERKGVPNDAIVFVSDDDCPRRTASLKRDRGGVVMFVVNESSKRLDTLCIVDTNK